MVGGDEIPFKKAEPVIDCYSKRLNTRPSGSGQLTKMVNQICIASLVGLSEAINWYERRIKYA